MALVLIGCIVILFVMFVLYAIGQILGRELSLEGGLMMPRGDDS
jgi:hypothetical protein